MEWEGTSPVPSHFSAQFRLSGPGKQALPAAKPQLIVFQIDSFDFIRRDQIGPVCADKAVSQLKFQFIEASQKIYSAVGCMEQDMVGDSGSFKKENIAQRDVAHGFVCPQSEHLRRVLTFLQQTHMDFTQTL